MANPWDSDKPTDHYEVLGVPVNSMTEEIKASYRKLALKWHPDRHSGNEDSEISVDEATERFKRVRCAFGPA